MKNYDLLKVVATKLNGLQYGMEDRTVEELDNLCKENGIVICFGQSDDLMELRGAIYDEYGCYDGGTICIDEKGNEEADTNLYYPITAVWCKDDISWQYEFEPKHEVFTIYEDADIYCKGIVFFVDDLKRVDEREQYIQSLIERDTAKKVEWENEMGFRGRVCPTCGHRSYYCASRNEEPRKQPDNFCSKCGQRFEVE